MLPGPEIPCDVHLQHTVEAWNDKVARAIFVARSWGISACIAGVASTICLRPAMKRGNVCVEMAVPVARVLFNAQKRAVGVRVRQGSGVWDIHLQREIILAAGAAGRQKILQFYFNPRWPISRCVVRVASAQPHKPGPRLTGCCCTPA